MQDTWAAYTLVAPLNDQTGPKGGGGTQEPLAAMLKLDCTQALCSRRDLMTHQDGGHKNTRTRSVQI